MLGLDPTMECKNGCGIVRHTVITVGAGSIMLEIIITYYQCYSFMLKLTAYYSFMLKLTAYYSFQLTYYSQFLLNVFDRIGVIRKQYVVIGSVQLLNR